ncbi:MAG: polyphosphate kinase 1 [Acidobacteriota bacterium]|nr:MAG: polyphosphate kinase 1 [Acidobacteriota bacterium]
MSGVAANTTQSAEKAKKGSRSPNLNHPTYYINRELSWLEFNLRVFQEGLDARLPLLERVKFLSIFSSNLDEFFMIRVSGLRRQLSRGALKAPPDGMTPAQQLARIRDRLLPIIDEMDQCWEKDLQPKLYEAGIKVVPYKNLKKRQRKMLRKHFQKEVFPILTPLAIDPSHPFPHISNLSVNLGVMIKDPGYGTRFARLKVPHILPRLVRVPSEEEVDRYTSLGLEQLRSTEFVWLEEVVAANLDLMFPGFEILGAYPFRVTRNADVEIEEDEAADLLEATKEMVGQRHFGFAIRVEIDDRMPNEYLNILVQNLDLSPYQIYKVKGPVGLTDLIQLSGLDRPDLKDKPFQPAISPVLSKAKSILSVIRKRNVLLYHPYDSFSPTVDFVRQAAVDPDVLAIKMTLYRVGPNSPIVQALKSARENGKQVSALVELKARFDEENNIEWAEALEEAGVHVIYGLLGLKTHAKMCLVVRKEGNGLARYVHLGTGNYNPVTARIYTDLGYLTTDPQIATDVSVLFNSLTGYSREVIYNKIVVAPHDMRNAILKRIKREVDSHKKNGNGRIIFKMNSLVDKACIRALYQASQAGVRIDLQVRGICCLRPGVPRVSENIRVTSIVGRFLEHSRIFYFHNNGNEDILLGSADLMPRNLEGRVEVLFPLEDPGLIAAVREDILKLHLKDRVKCWELNSDGEYKRLQPEEGREGIHSQLIRLSEPGSWHFEE